MQLALLHLFKPLKLKEVLVVGIHHCILVEGGLSSCLSVGDLSTVERLRRAAVPRAFCSLCVQMLVNFMQRCLGFVLVIVVAIV